MIARRAENEARANALLSDAAAEHVRTHAIAELRHLAKVWQYTRAPELVDAMQHIESIVRAEQVGLAWRALPEARKLCKRAVERKPLCIMALELLWIEAREASCRH